MISALQKLALKPSDAKIRTTRGIFALLLVLVIVFGWKATTLNFGLPEYIKYILFIFPAVGLVRSLFDPGIFRKKIWKWTIVGLGSAMILLSLIVLEDATVEPSVSDTTVSGEITIGTLTQSTAKDSEFTLSTDNWFGFFGFVLVIVGLLLNGKNITSKNERYGEKVTKIRV